MSEFQNWAKWNKLVKKDHMLYTHWYKSALEKKSIETESQLALPQG